MNGKALGIIETVGLVPSVEAADVAVKTAEVSLIGSQAVGGGLVSILMKGDVAAVKASVDAGSQAASRIGELRSVTVIARTAEGLEGILLEEGKTPKWVPAPSACEPEIVLETTSEEPGERLPEKEDSGTTDSASEEALEGLSLELSELKKMKVTKLRRLARQLPTFGITRGEIKYAKKSELLEAFAQYMASLEQK